jgi:hypothetical protein
LDPGAECVIFGVKEFESPEDEELIDLLEEECD